MSEIVNLRAARKRRLRQDRERQAAANRQRFGRTKAERAAETAERARAGRQIEGHRLDEPE